MTKLASQSMPQRLPPGCIEDRDRHGKFRVYYRRKGFPKGTPSRHALDFGVHGPIRRSRKDRCPDKARRTRATDAPKHMVMALLRYFDECTDYKRLDPRTRHVRRQILEATFDELIRAGFGQAVRRHAACEDECQRGRNPAGPQTSNT